MGIFSRLTGKGDIEFFKEKYQKQIDEDYRAVKEMIRYLEEKSVKLKHSYNQALGYKKNIEAHEEDREKSYNALGNLLSKEEKLEKEMWKITTDMQKDVAKSQKTSTVKQKTKFGDQEVTFNSMMKILDKYPEYQSKSTYKEILRKISEIEKEIKQSKEKYNSAVVEYNSRISTFPGRMQKMQDKINEYNKHLNEWSNEIKSARFTNSVFFKLLDARAKAELKPDTTAHRMTQFENSYKDIKEDLAKFQKREFVEMEF